MQSEGTVSRGLPAVLPLPRSRVSLPRLRIQERKWLLSGVDVILAVAQLIAAYAVWHARVHPASDNMGHTPWVWIIGGAFCWYLLSWLAGAYELEVADHLGRAYRMIAVTWVPATVVALAAYYLFPKTYPRPALLAVLIAVPAAVGVWRTVYASLLRRPLAATRVLVVGHRPFYEALCEGVTVASRYYTLVGYAADAGPDGAHLGGTDDLTVIVERYNVHRIVVAPRQPLSTSLIATLTACIERGVEVVDFNSAYEEATSKIAVDHVGDQWLTALPTRVSTSSLEEMAMRLLDVIGAVVGLMLTALLAPMIAAAIVLDSGLPVLYRQERLGRGGNTFTIYKFRSMRTDAERAGAQWASASDSRVTRVGRFLRRTHLDELPQFLNVLRGEMSLVGPRPERPSFTAELEREIPFYRLRLAVRPGLTGLKQIRVGYASSVDDHLEVLRHDLYYIKHRSLGLNLVVVARTVGSVLGMNGR